MTEAVADYPEILTDLADKLTEVLVKRGIEREQAQAIGHEAVEFVRREWGGQLLYVPKGRAFDLSQRDLEIWRKWNGRNAHELCREHGITLQRLYQVVATVREQEIQRRQGKLF